ncbi:MAG: 4Fe-4S dicluster domain-containing protein [Adlercreutzia equolifaciens]
MRHRVYHKLNGFLAKHDRNLCVGCGRCVFRLQS